MKYVISLIFVSYILMSALNIIAKDQIKSDDKLRSQIVTLQLDRDEARRDLDNLGRYVKFQDKKIDELVNKIKSDDAYVQDVEGK